MKKAFTLSEALVTLAILGVLAAILIPVLDNVRPDKDKIMYKKAMYAMQSAASSAIDEISKASTNASAYWADESFSANTFCEQVAESLNLAGRHYCATNSWTTQNPKKYVKGDESNRPDFITTDGVMWWKLSNYKFGNASSDPNTANSTVHDIVVTRKDQYDKSGNWKEDYDPLRIQVRYDGKVGTGIPRITCLASEKECTYRKENDLLEDSLSISKEHR